MVLRSFISAIVRSPIAVRLGLFSRTRQELAWQDELLSMSTRIRAEDLRPSRAAEATRRSMAALDQTSSQMFAHFEARQEAARKATRERQAVASYSSLKQAMLEAQNNPPDPSLQREAAVHELAAALERGSEQVR
mmetsp:Transcript_49858/g.157771  ORF Transcript_49858/g.157771 Transcript_49858/m.157771 type:complete len:135 (-) Transcript_49858:14-418(-)